MKTIICEKPSQAMDIAKGLNFDFKHDKSKGYLENNQYFITWGYGHLIKIDDSQLKTESIEQLPIFPERFEYTVIDDKGAQKQYQQVEICIQKSNEIIIATDAGREGELIARLILIQAGYKNWNNVYRFWSSEALTKEVVKREIKNIKPANDYNYLFFQGLSRQHADWTVGINMSRIVSMKAKGKWSVGRVQTPTLKFIHQRTIENIQFDKQKYCEIIIETSGAKGKIQTEKRLNKEQAEQIFSEINNISFVEVSDKETKRVEKKAPQLFDLSALQQAANNKYGFSANETLQIAQSLYEKHKVLSYPRTESKFMGNDNQGFVKNIIEKLDLPEEIKEKIDINRPEKNVFDSSKLTDHHALVVLNKAENLNEKEQKVYDLVKARFLAAFMPKYIYNSIQVQLKIGKYIGRIEGKEVLQFGWRSLWQENDELPDVDLKQVEKGKKVKLDSKRIEEKETKPPALFTDAKILKQMEKSHLGTAATRSGIIEKLIKVGYIEKSGKKYTSTEKGAELVNILEYSDLLNVEMTEKWEKTIDAVKEKEAYRYFLEDIKKFTSKEVEKIKKKQIKQVATVKQRNFALKLAQEKKTEIDKSRLNDAEYLSQFIEQVKDKTVIAFKCGCGGDVELKGVLYQCGSCGLKVFKKFFNKTLTEKQIKSLYQNETILVKGLISKKKKKYNGNVQIKDGRAQLIFDK